jgi:hypothetical protein
MKLSAKIANLRRELVINCNIPVHYQQVLINLTDEARAMEHMNKYYEENRDQHIQKESQEER